MFESHPGGPREWVFSFWDWFVAVQLLLSAQLCVTPWIVTRQTPLSMRFPRQEYWSGLPFPPPREPPNPQIEPGTPALAGRFFTTEAPEKTSETDNSWLPGKTKMIWQPKKFKVASLPTSTKARTKLAQPLLPGQTFHTNHLSTCSVSFPILFGFFVTWLNSKFRNWCIKFDYSQHKFLCENRALQNRTLYVWLFQSKSFALREKILNCKVSLFSLERMDFIALFYKEPTAIEVGHRVGGKASPSLWNVKRLYTRPGFSGITSVQGRHAKPFQTKGAA